MRFIVILHRRISSCRPCPGTVNLNGKKYDPSDFERFLFAVDGLREGCFAAFGIDDPGIGSQQLVIVSKVRESTGRSHDDILRDMRRQIATRMNVTVSASPGLNSTAFRYSSSAKTPTSRTSSHPAALRTWPTSTVSAKSPAGNHFIKRVTRSKQRVNKRRGGARGENQEGGEGQHHEDERKEPELLGLPQKTHEFGEEIVLLLLGGFFEIVFGGHGRTVGLFVGF